MLLDVHLECCDDNGEMLKQLADIGKPFNISIVPGLMLPEHEVFKNGVYRPGSFYNKNIIDSLKEIKDYPHITFGQQGFLHYCSDCHKTLDITKKRFKHDPWHENKCLYNNEKLAYDQFLFMKEGKKTIEKIIGVSPIIYCPPNHQYDENTKLSVIELGYEYLAIKGMINISPYTEEGLKILPERKIGSFGEIFYTHYDEIENKFDKCAKVIKSSKPLSEIKFKDSSVYSSLNEMLVTASKFARDKGLR
ncbi:MAG: hypothetical protein AABX88_00665 [Nanoarchaeota archaeon]